MTRKMTTSGRRRGGGEGGVAVVGGRMKIEEEEGVLQLCLKFHFSGVCEYECVSVSE